MNAPELPLIFHALGDSTRWDILQRVGTNASSASALAQHLPVSRQAIARHLSVLEAAGLVTANKSGKEVQFAADSAQILKTASALERIATGWSRRLARIRIAAEQPDSL